METGLEIVAVEGEHRIDSRLVAKGIHIQHDNLMQTIHKYQKGLERYGTFLFQTGTSKHRTGASKFAYVLLNKEQFGYLLMFVRITDQVREYREYVYDKFLEYERLQRAPQKPIPQINSLWQQRLEIFYRQNKLPAGYWCLFGMVGGYCWTDEFREVYLLVNSLPDGSIGKKWCQHLRSRGYDMSLVKKYPHHYPDQRGTVQANLYPNAWLGEFWTWFHERYLKEDYPEYLKTHRLPAAQMQQLPFPQQPMQQQ
ncbi:MAG TPA: Rha family transcriptional regulator [Ktedonobacteraceae bacterium]|nr:Rha family transcriptional regulator [Ktedonobacteraceae bacterium]